MSSWAPARPFSMRVLGGAVVAAAGAGVLLAARPAFGAAVFGGVIFLTLAMMSVPVAIAIWTAALFVVFGLPTTGMQLVIAAAWLGSLVARPALIRQVLPGQRWLVGALSLMMAWLCLSSLWAHDAEMTWQELRWWLVAAGALIVVATTIDSPEQVKLVMLGLVVGAVLSTIIGLLHSPASPPSTTAVGLGPSRFAGLEGNPNDLAAQLIPAVVFATVLLVDARRWIIRLALACSIIALAVAFAATESRAGLLAAIAVVIAAVLLLGHAPRRRVLVIVALITASAVTWFALSPSALRRVTSFNDGGAGRSTLWLVAWRMTKDNAPEGVGLNNFRLLAPNYVRQPGALRYLTQIDSPHVVHNTYLQLLAETGPLGLSLFLAVAGTCLAAALRAKRIFGFLGRAELARLSLAALLGMLSALVVQIFQSGAYDLRFWIVMGLGPALLSIALTELWHRQGGRRPAGFTLP
jgi:O-antigen ligase